MNNTPLEQTIAWGKKEGVNTNPEGCEIIVESFKNKTLVSIDTRGFIIQGFFKDNKLIKYTLESQTEPVWLLTPGNYIVYEHKHFCPLELRGI